ncbi:MAG: sugar ABC transporter permease [Anaerolineae bacterium]|nr:sugar ABC transporter permease [Candidatus Roseilinea sp.]MDW8450544.1 sugar ABC transporter permease [Anaerolineae bacterium]
MTLRPHARKGRHSGKYALVAPATMMILCIALFPLLYSVVVSFQNIDVRTPVGTFVGLKNYFDVLRDARFWNALGNTALIMTVCVTAELVLGFILAQTLIGPLPGKRFITPLLILPVVIAPLIVGYTWRMLWDTQYGPISQVLGWIAGRPVEIVWLANPATVWPAIFITEIWQWTPFMFLVLLAGLAAINPEYREAAEIDGASSWQVLRFVTLPLVWPVMAVAILFRALDAFKVFDIVFALTNGGPGTMTETVSLYAYSVGFRNFRISYMAALTLILIAIVSVAITVLWRRMSANQERMA